MTPRRVADEIHLSDLRRTPPERQRTILRQPVAADTGGDPQEPEPRLTVVDELGRAGPAKPAGQPAYQDLAY